MGILSGVIQFRGRVGQLVGRKLSDTAIINSGKAGRVSLAAYQPDVTNPKTEAQSTQRMKMTAAVAFYRMMSQVLNNAFQNEKYGTRSHNRFLSLAMKQTTGVPFLDKGTTAFFPGEYTLSVGSIPALAVTGQSETGALVTSLNSGGSIAGDTFGALSQKIINANFGLLDGDRLTFVGFGQRYDGSFAPVYSYIILNTASEDASDLILSSMRLSLSYDNAGENNNQYVGFVFTNTGYQSLVGGAVIVSRAPEGNASAWLRSNAVAWLNDSYKNEYMGTDRFNAAIATYSKSVSVLSSDWYLNLGLYSNTNGSSVVGSLTIESVSTTTFSFGRAAIIRLSDGTMRAGSYPLASAASGNQIVESFGEKYIGTEVDASADNLAIIKNQYPNVTGYMTVPASLYYPAGSGMEDAGEDRP